MVIIEGILLYDCDYSVVLHVLNTLCTYPSHVDMYVASDVCIFWLSILLIMNMHNYVPKVALYVAVRNKNILNIGLSGSNTCHDRAVWEKSPWKS